jgi:hypothetical protein
MREIARTVQTRGRRGEGFGLENPPKCTDKKSAKLDSTFKAVEEYKSSAYWFTLLTQTLLFSSEYLFKSDYSGFLQPEMGKCLL